MPIRAKDIAEILSVSPATVSIVLNNKPGVSDEVRNTIIGKIKDLNCEYLLKNIPKTTNSGTIGFVVYKRVGNIIDESPFFKYSIEQINMCLNQHGYDFKFIYINKKSSYDENRSIIVESHCKGLIIFAVEMYEDDLELFINTHLPFVLMDNSFQTRDVDCVAVNNIQGVSKAIQYLAKMGHKKIGYIKSSIQINSFEERFKEYLNQLQLLELSYSPDFVLETDYSESGVASAVLNFLDRGVYPTAFFADNDLLGCYALKEFKQNGYRVPEDFSIIGFDNRPICTLMEPQLTTVDIPQDLFGPSCANLLIEKIQHPRKQSIKVDIGTDLIIRSSVQAIQEH